MQFKNPPLVELIAELRWLPPGVRLVPGAPQNMEMPMNLLAGGQADALCMSFGAQVINSGYSAIERVLPPQVPAFPFQPVFRYSKPKKAGEPTLLYQLGSGIFSAHTTPPYKSWDDFRPEVESGIRQLLAVRSAEDNANPMIAASVRYLDAFTDEFLQNRTIPTFMSKTLGIDLRLPSALGDLIPPTQEMSPQIRLTLPLHNALQMTLALSEGQAAGARALIMDSSVGSTSPIPCEIGEIMRVLDSARAVVSSAFTQMTERLHAIMEPVH